MSDDRQTLPNFEAGSIWAAWILSKLADNWPQETKLNWYDPIEATKVIPLTGNGQQSMRGLLLWLRKEGYIRFENWTVDWEIQDCEITEKAFTRLKMAPESLGGDTIREALGKAVGEVAKETAKSQLADLFGQFLGGFTKSVSG
jgi:hypothetical protein